jgi:hypothetical protein
MEKLDIFAAGFFIGFMACVVVVLGLFEADRPKLDLSPIGSASSPLAMKIVAPRIHLTKNIEQMAVRDHMKLTRQKCDYGQLCVTCFVSTDERHLLGESWTYCPSYDICREVVTYLEKDFYGADFGACERNEVPSPVGAL